MTSTPVDPTKSPVLGLEGDHKAMGLLAAGTEGTPLLLQHHRVSTHQVETGGES